MVATVFPPTDVLVERVDGKFTLTVVDLDSRLEVRIPLTDEGAAMLREDINQTIDTAEQVALVEGKATSR